MNVNVNMIVCMCIHTLDTRWHVIYKYIIENIDSQVIEQKRVFFLVFKNLQAPDKDLKQNQRKN